MRGTYMNIKNEADDFLKRFGICKEAKILEKLLTDSDIPFEETGCNEWYGRCFYAIHYPKSVNDWNSEITVKQDNSKRASKKPLIVFISETDEIYKNLSAIEAFDIIKGFHLKHLQKNLEKAQNALNSFMSR